MKDIKLALRNGETLIGTFAVSGSPTVIEAMGHAGIFDFVIIDTEHSPTDPFGFQLNQLIGAAQLSGITPWVRVTQNDYAMILKALNFGAKGIVVPHLNNKEQAVKMVDACRYWPKGHGSAAQVHRAARYNWDPWPQYWRRANEEVLVVPLIEEETGVVNLEDILTVGGIDVVFLGPFDLSMTYGLDGEYNHPRMIEAIERVLRLCREKGLPVCCDAGDLETAKMWVNKGCQIVTVSADLFDLQKVYKEMGPRITKELKTPRRSWRPTS